MNRFLSLLIIAAVALASSVFGKPPKTDQQDFSKLLEPISDSEHLREYYETLAHRDTEPAYKIELAERQIAIAETNIPKIEALVKPKTSIFDYPGLLAHGRIRYNPDPPGRYYFTFEPVMKHEFRIEFDRRGIITSVAKESFRH